MPSFILINKTMSWIILESTFVTRYDGLRKNSPYQTQHVIIVHIATCHFNSHLLYILVYNHIFFLSATFSILWLFSFSFMFFFFLSFSLYPHSANTNCVIFCSPIVMKLLSKSNILKGNLTYTKWS